MARKYIVLSAAVMLLSLSAAHVAQAATAQAAVRTDPKCALADDKVGCTCAMQNGGAVDTDSRGNMHWSYPERSINAFAACMVRNGRS